MVFSIEDVVIVCFGKGEVGVVPFGFFAEYISADVAGFGIVFIG